MPATVGEIRSAPEHVQHTGIDSHAATPTERLVQPLRIDRAQVGDRVDAEVVQIPGDARPDAGNAQQLVAWDTGHGDKFTARTGSVHPPE